MWPRSRGVEGGLRRRAPQNAGAAAVHGQQQKAIPGQQQKAIHGQQQKAIHGQQQKEYILFLGNTGVGKSAICNALGGSCESTTRAEAVTSKCSQHVVHFQDREFVLIDAPGLYEANATHVERNVKEISNALKYDGNYRLVFVLCLSGGRFPYGEAAVMKCIATAVKREKGPIGVILNKLDENEMELLQDEEGASTILRSIETALVSNEDCQFGISRTKATAAEVKLFRMPRDGVGCKWIKTGNCKIPHADLSKWLSDLVSTKITSVGTIRSQAEVEGEMKLKLEMLQTQLDEEKKNMQEALQQVLDSASRYQQQTQYEDVKLQNSIRTTSPQYGGAPKALETQITSRSHLPSKSNDKAQMKLDTYFQDVDESVEIHVDKEGFELFKRRGMQLSYIFLSIVTIGIVPASRVAISWIVFTRGLQINTPKAREWGCGRVTKIESVVEVGTKHNKREFKDCADAVYDNTRTDFEGVVNLSEFTATETRVDHTLGAEVGLDQVHSMLVKCNMTLPNFTGLPKFSMSGERREEITTSSRLTANTQTGAVSTGGRAETLTLPLPPRKKLVVQTWCREEVWTTEFSTRTRYDGMVLWCGSRGDKIPMPASALWPSTEKKWELIQTRIDRWRVTL